MFVTIVKFYFKIYNYIVATRFYKGGFVAKEILVNHLIYLVCILFT